MKKLIIMGVITILLLPSLSSFSLRKGIERVYFEPGLEREVTFIIDNYDGPDRFFRTMTSTKSEELSGILDEIIHIREPEFTIEVGEKRELYVDVKLPQSLSYGIHDILIMTTTTDPEQRKGQIAVRESLAFPIRIYALFPGKQVDSSFLRPSSANIGESIAFKIIVRNIGTEDIKNGRAKIDIYKDDEKVGNVYSDSYSIKSKEEAEFIATLPITDSYQIGEYRARAFIEYDGEVQDVRYAHPFNIGQLSINILNITSRQFQNNKINKFDIIVESKWNKPIDVYADVILTDLSGVEVTKFKTQTVTIEGWKQKIVPVYFDANNIENGNYMLKVILNYGDKTSVRTFVVHVGDIGEAEIVEEMPGMPKQSVIIILLGTVIVLLIIIIVLMLFFKRKKGINNEIR